jgi:hypothetical protein
MKMSDGMNINSLPLNKSNGNGNSFTMDKRDLSRLVDYYRMRVGKIFTLELIFSIYI